MTAILCCPKCERTFNNTDSLPDNAQDKVTCGQCDYSGPAIEFITQKMPVPDEPIATDICPDCGRPKACIAVDIMRGACPKWYATHDDEAAQDCERQAAQGIPMMDDPVKVRDRIEQLEQFGLIGGSMPLQKAHANKPEGPQGRCCRTCRKYIGNECRNGSPQVVCITVADGIKVDPRGHPITKQVVETQWPTPLPWKWCDGWQHKTAS